MESKRLSKLQFLQNDEGGRSELTAAIVYVVEKIDVVCLHIPNGGLDTLVELDHIGKEENKKITVV